MFGDVAEWGAAHPDVGWLVEFKGSWTAAQMDGPVATLRRHGLAGRTILQSFEPATVEAARDVAPDLPRALLVYRREHLDGLLERLQELGAAGCNPIGQLPIEMPGLAARLREAGLQRLPVDPGRARRVGRGRRRRRRRGHHQPPRRLPRLARPAVEPGRGVGACLLIGALSGPPPPAGRGLRRPRRRPW